MADQEMEQDVDAAETASKDEDSSSSSSDDDDGSVKEAATEASIAELEKTITENQYAYDAHVQVISKLKSIGELDRLRAARERMSKLFPLTEELWLAWLRDEISIATTPEEKKQVTNLFERAVKDYLSVDIWLEWAQFSMGNVETDCYQGARTILSRAVTAAGLHVTKGALLWEASREFENCVLNQIQTKAMSKEDEEEETKSQREQITQLFRRQLDCPLLDMEATYEELKKWGTNMEVATCDFEFKRGLKKLKEILPFEEKLLQSQGEEQVAIYESYLTHEKKHGNPNRVGILYERAVAQFALNAQFWSDYITYADKVVAIQNWIQEVAERALRNVPWDSRPWVAYIRAMERHSKKVETIQAVFERSLTSGISTVADYRAVWEAYLDSLKRLVPWEEGEELARAQALRKLRACCLRAHEHLTELFGEEGDPQNELFKAWARWEASHAKDMEHTRQIWTDILKNPNLYHAAAPWLEYASLEMQYGDHKHVRKLFAKALTVTKDWPESIGQAWIKFERDQGDLESFEAAVEKVDARLKKVAEEREKEQQTTSKFQKLKLKRRHPESSEQEKQWDKRGRGSQEGGRSSQEKTKDKPVKNEEGKWSNMCLFSKKPPAESKESDSAYKGRDETGSSVGKEHRTVFVSNLDYSTDEQQLREIFSPIGAITDLRLVKDFKGRSKGYCYVEFSSQTEAEAALKKDREKVSGRPMFVSKCDPDRQTREKNFRFSVGLEKNKLFVRGLPVSMSENDVRTLFQPFGTLLDVRLVTYRNGHSKGLAYVDFKNEVEAAAALLKTDGLEIEGHKLTVAISSPPERKMQQASLLAPEVPSLGGRSRDIGAKRSSNLMVPRNVRLAMPPSHTEMEVDSPAATVAPANGEVSSPSAPPATSAKAKSNADFRSMLLGNKSN